MGKGGVVAECFEVDEFDKNVGVLFRVARLGELKLDIVDLSINYLLFGRLVFGLADHLDQRARLLADQLRDLLVAEEVIHPRSDYYKPNYMPIK